MAGSYSQIPAPRVPFLDPQTNMVTPQWFLWFNNVYGITGSGVGIVAVGNGGTGLGTTPSNGQLLIGNGTGYSLNTLFASAGISVTNGAGAISLANTGVLSNIAGTGITVSSATGNVTVAIDSTVATLTGTQTLQNKTLDNTNTVTLLDTLFTLQDNLDNTKQAQFQLSAIATATTSTYTLPAASTTLAGLATTQTFAGNLTFSGNLTATSSIFTRTATTQSWTDGSMTTGAWTVGGTAQTGGITLGRSTAAQTLNIATGATATATTKTVNIGTAGLNGSTTAINIGSAVAGATTTVNAYGACTFNTPIGVASGGTGSGVAYTVATLPAAGTQGRRAWVTDALAPTFGAAVVGGGAVVIPVFDDGTTWIVG